MKLPCFLLPTLLFLSVNTAQAQVWATRSLPYRSTTIKIISAKTVMIGGQVPKVLRTDDGGMSWAEANQGIKPLPHDIQSPNITDIHFFNLQTGILIAEDAYTRADVYRTVNGGKEWKMIAEDVPFKYFAIGEKGQGHSYSSDVLSFSSDSGQTWSKPLFPNPYSPVPAGIDCMDWVDKKTYWMYGHVNYKKDSLYKTDGTGPWSARKTPGNRIKLVCFPVSDKGYVLGDQGELYKTSDDGNSWTLLNVPSNGRKIACIRFTDEKNGWVAGEDEMIFRTGDGGMSWQQCYMNWGKTDFYGHFSITRLEIGSDNGWAITDRGAVLRSFDGGNSWSLNNAGTQATLNSVFFTDRMRGIIVGESGTLIMTENGGRSWNDRSLPELKDRALKSVFFYDAANGWIVGANKLILSTQDSGRTWKADSIPTTYPVHLKAVQFISRDTGWVMDDASIYATTDGGKSWTERRIGTVLKSFHFINGSAGWCCGGNGDDNEGFISKTTDGGLSWIKQKQLKIDKMLYSIQALDEQNLVAAASDGKIILSTDGGASYTINTGTRGYKLRSLHFINKLEGWSVGSSTVLYTSDGGLTWRDQYHSRGGTAIFMIDRDYGWTIGPNGLIVSTAATVSDVPDRSMPEPEGSMKLQVFPNPAVSTLHISIGTASAAPAALRIFDEQGLLVQRRILHPAGGDSAWDIDVQHLAPGIYFIELAQNESRSVEKILISRDK